MMEYAEVYQKNYENQIAMFDEIAGNIVKVTNVEVEGKLKRRFRKKRKYWYEHLVLLHILASPNNMGVTWDEHTASIIDYNSNQTYKQAVIYLREGNLKVDKRLIDNQAKREINYKPTSKNLFSGQIDNEIAYIINEIKRKVYKHFGITKVQVVGILDEKTCETCDYFIGKVYDIDDIVIGEQVGSHINCRCYIQAWSTK